MNKHTRNLIIGPAIFAVCTLLLAGALGLPGAQAVGTLLWMVFWWVVRPVNITVTAFLPVILNAIFGIVPKMGDITSQYVSDSIILIFGSGLLCMPWAKIGLDKRIALKTLTLVGTSISSQITGWLLTSIVMSSVMPNVAVCALLTPIAVSMFHAAGYEDIPTCKPAVPILLAIGWGVTLGGAGTPLGGAMNLAAITFIEDFTGVEFMYMDWVIRILPYMIIATIALLVYMLKMPTGVKELNGSKDYFQNSYDALGPMKRDEKICATLFILAVLAAFARPMYEDLLPALAPAYAFLILGSLAFFIPAEDGSGPLLTWEVAQKQSLWGMMILFGGGLALGKLIGLSGAAAGVADIIAGMSFSSDLMILIVFFVVARLIAEATNGTTTAAVVMPILMAFSLQLGINPIPFWLAVTMAYNAEFMLPLSVRAIPVAYGLDANIMLKWGAPMTLISTIVGVGVSYILMNIWPMYTYFSNYTFPG